jgi:hypothetical protein
VTIDAIQVLKGVIETLFLCFFEPNINFFQIFIGDIS